MPHLITQKYKDMKITNFLMLLALVLVGFTSCKKDAPVPDIAAKVVTESNGSTYNGSFNANTYQSTDYDVVVTKVSNTKVKITPEDSKGTAFEVTIIEASGKITATENQVVFQEINGVMTLSYNTSGGEQFSGKKQ